MNTFIERIPVSWRSPSYHRSNLLRRVLSIFLLACAALLFFGEHTKQQRSYVVLSADLSPGTIIGPEHLSVRNFPPDFDVSAAFTATKDPVGRVVATPLRSGDIIQQHHLLGPELGEALGTDSLVPIKLSDPAAAELAIPGAHVAVVAAHSDQETTVLVQGARVVFGTERKTDSTDAGTVLLAMDTASATRVAAASLGTPLTVVLTAAL